MNRCYQNSFLSGEPLRFFLTGMSAIDCSAVETKGTEVVTTSDMVVKSVQCRGKYNEMRATLHCIFSVTQCLCDYCMHSKYLHGIVKIGSSLKACSIMRTIIVDN